VSRRAVLTGAVAGAVTVAGTATAAVRRTRPAGRSGPHQPGIVTPALPYLSLAGFDVVVRGRDALAGLLRTWTGAAEQLTAAGTDLTLTFGFGPSLFAGDRFGIGDRRPASLVPLPSFPDESIDPAAGNGDLCVQACAGDPTTAHHAVRALLNAARAEVSLRWRQTGFRTGDGTFDPPGLFGFRDGTVNLDVALQAPHLWVDDGPDWLHGGSYLVMRRIRLLLDTWDRTDRATQEAMIGRDRDTNRRLAVPTSHTALAAPAANGGATMLRRSYSYDAGTDPNGLMDAGLIFLSYQRDPAQFVAVQRRLAAHDPLNGFSQHLAGGVYACPPGVRPGSFLGSELLS
jgi:deferrochelatase/peroxidase EfeB